MLIKVRGSRRDLVRRQKNNINYVNKHYHGGNTDENVRGAIAEFQKDAQESGLFKDTRGSEPIVTYQKKEDK